MPHYDAAPAREVFFSQPPGIRDASQVWLGNPSPLVFFRRRSKQLPPSPPQDTSPCAHLHPPPSPPQVHGSKNSEESPPRAVTWLTCRFLRETAVPSSGRKTLPTKGVELENATTDTEAGANLVGPPGQENVFGAGQLFPERSKRSFIVQHPSYQCFQTMKLHRSQKKPPF